VEQEDKPQYYYELL